jgi:hypothetical protein
VPLVQTTQTYLQYARTLSKHWERSFLLTAFKLVASRVLYQRGPAEFDKFRFTSKPLREWRAYTVESDLLSLRERWAPEPYRDYDEDKVLFATHCRRSDLPTVPILAVVAPAKAGPQESDTGYTVGSSDELAKVFHAVGDFDGFAKPRRAGAGYGAFAFAVRSGVVTAPWGTGSTSDLFAYCAAGEFARDGYVLQPHVRPHASLLPLMPGPGLGTVRVVSLLMRNGEVVMPASWIKIPAPAADCDDARLDGSLVGVVDVETGALRTPIGVTAQRPVMHDVECHPTTGARFADATLPLWPEVLALVTRAARAFDMLPALGWDVAITPDGPLLIETNWHFGSFERALDHGNAADFRAWYARIAEDRG